MSKTLEALDKFARTLPTTTLQPVPDRDVPAAPTLAPVSPRAADSAVAGPRSSGAGESAGAVPGSEAPFRWSELLHAAAPHDPVVRAEAEDARPAADSGPSGAFQCTDLESVAGLAVAMMSPPATSRSEGTTRRGSRGEWGRVRGLVGFVVLAVTVGIGCQFLVRVSASAGEARWRKGVGRSLSHTCRPAARSHSSGAKRSGRPSGLRSGRRV